MEIIINQGSSVLDNIGYRPDWKGWLLKSLLKENISFKNDCEIRQTPDGTFLMKNNKLVSFLTLLNSVETEELEMIRDLGEGYPELLIPIADLYHKDCFCGDCVLAIEEHVMVNSMIATEEDIKKYSRV